MRAHALLIGSCLCLGLALPAACGGSSDGGSSGTISSQVLAGKVGGMPWTFMAGETDTFLSDAQSWVANVYEVPIDSPCSNSTPTGSQGSLILTMGKTAGTYPLGLDRTATFYITSTSDNLAATSGTIQVTSVDATTIRGGAHFQFNAANSVDGQFVINICP